MGRIEVEKFLFTRGLLRRTSLLHNKFWSNMAAMNCSRRFSAVNYLATICPQRPVRGKFFMVSCPRRITCDELSDYKLSTANYPQRAICDVLLVAYCLTTISPRRSVRIVHSKLSVANCLQRAVRDELLAASCQWRIIRRRFVRCDLSATNCLQRSVSGELSGDQMSSNLIYDRHFYYDFVPS